MKLLTCPAEKAPSSCKGETSRAEKAAWQVEERCLLLKNKVAMKIMSISKRRHSRGTPSIEPLGLK